MSTIKVVQNGSISFGKNKSTLDNSSSRAYYKPDVKNVNMINSVYRGKTDRFEKYKTYDWMDRDSDVSRALDLISEHCTEQDIEERFFKLKWRNDEASASISRHVIQSLDQWSARNYFVQRLNKIVRNIIKYGDWFLFRDPNTFHLYNVHPKNVLGALIDQSSGDIIGWVIKDFRPDIQTMEIDLKDNKEYNNFLKNFNNGSALGVNSKVVPAIHILHLSMSEGKFDSISLDQLSNDKFNQIYPFGESWLEQIYKTFKQRELIEDASIIARVQRAPTRNVWYIDVGLNRNDRSSWIVENFKNELNEKRVPQFLGNNTNSKSVDSVYNPISQLEDYFIPISANNRGSKVEKLEGTPWTDLPELDYLKKKMMSALRIPYAWMLGSQEGGPTFSNARSGVAYQEEIEFSRFCTKIQNKIILIFDREFKLYCKWRDISFNASDFVLHFLPPDNYEESKRTAMLAEAAPIYANMKDIPGISTRFLLKNVFNFTEEQIFENERMFKEENRGMKAGSNVSSNDMGGMMGGFDDINITNDTNNDAIDAGTGATMPNIGQGDSSMGETFNKIYRTKKIINEENYFDTNDIPTAKSNGNGFTFGRDDNDVMNDDPLHGKVIIDLSKLQKMRRAFITKRIDKQKRLNNTLSIYKKPLQSDGI